MDFSKRYYTPEERAAAITEALACYNTAEEPWLIARSDEELVQTIKAAMPLAPPEISESRPLTKTEDNEIQFEVDIQSMFGGKYAPVEVPAWYRATHEQEQRSLLEKLAAPAIRERKSLEAMFKAAIEKAVHEQLVKAGSTPQRESDREPLPIRPRTEREGIHPAMAAVAGDDSNAGRLVKAWLENNREAMREIVRQCELGAA